MEFDITASNLGDGIHGVEVEGDLDLASAPELKAALATIDGSGTRGVLVDLSRATFIDSSALGILMGTAKHLGRTGATLAVACTDPNIRKIFEITLLDRIFAVCETPAAALAALQARNPTPPDERDRRGPGSGG